MIPLSKPRVTLGDGHEVWAVLESGRLACGPKAQEFADKVARRHGRKFGVPVSSGTAALHLILAASGVGPGDEVITTPFSFVASTNCILYCGATPVFVDIDPDTLLMDADVAEQAIGERTKAILDVEIFGQPRTDSTLQRTCENHGVLYVTDSCESLGAIGGCRGDAVAFAFYPNKQVTCGEGGVIATDDSHLAERCHALANHGRLRGQTECRYLGYNYRMDEMSGALGSSQMDRIDEILKSREGRAEQYMRILPECVVHLYGLRSWFVFVVILPGWSSRDSVIDYLGRHGVESRAYFNPIHLEPYMQSQAWRKHGCLTVAESAGSRCISLPFYIGITDSEIDTVVHTLRDALEDPTCQTTRKSGTATGKTGRTQTATG